METTEIQVSLTEYIQVNTGLGPITIEPNEREVRVAVSETQPALSNTAYHRISAKNRIQFTKPSTNTWVLGTVETPRNTKYEQTVRVTQELNTVEITADGAAGVAVFVQDQTTGVLDVPFLLQESALTLGADTVVGSRTITLAAGHGLTTISDAGKIIEVADSANGSFFFQCEVISVSTNDITLDCPVNRIYTVAGSIVAISVVDMNVDGSTIPQIFSVLPFPLQRGDMVRMIVEMRDDVAMDFETFGGIAALTNGVILRVNNGDGTFRNLYNFKSNGDIIKMGFDHEFQINNGNNVRGFTARITWGGQSKHGVVIRLDGSKFESLEMVVQDDLTGLSRMHWLAQGSEIQD